MIKKTFLLAAAITAVLFFPGTSRTDTAKKITLLVQPFSVSGDNAMNWAGKGITDTVVSDLAKIRSINVVTDEDRRRVLREIELSMVGLTEIDENRNIAILTGANLIVTGSCTVAKNNLRVTAKIIQVDTGKILSSIKLDDNIENIFQLQDKIVTSLIEETRKANIEGFIIPALTTEDKNAIASKSIPKISSYELYSKALSIAESDPTGALALCEKAIEADPDYYEVHVLAGWIENLTGKPQIGLARLARAGAILKRRNIKKGLSTAFIDMNKAVIQWSLKRYTECFDSYYEAKTIYENAGMTDSSAFASILIGMGSAKRALGDNKSALDISLKGLQIYEKLGLKKTSPYAWALTNTGIIYTMDKDYKTGLKLFNESSSIFKSIGLEKSQGYALTEAQAGYVFLYIKNFDESLKRFFNSVNTASKLNLDIDDNYAWYYWNIAVIYFDKKKDACTALPYINKTVKIFTSTGSGELSGAKEALKHIQGECKK
jgi:TolB-like protein